MKNSHSPLCSVLMSVYKEDDLLLKRSIESVLGQTFSNFEFIIINDGMTESNLKTINLFNDDRIKLIKNDANLGLTRSLNKAARLAQGEYLIRLDSDDYCIGTRFKDQLNFMNDNPQVILCGGRESVVDGEDFIESKVRFLGDNLQILKGLSTYNPFIHSTLIIRKKAFEKVGGYNESFRYAQDFDLVFRLSKVGQLANMDKVLVFRVIDDTSISIEKQRLQMFYALKTRLKALFSYGGNTETIFSLFRSFAVLILPKFLLNRLRRVFR